MRRAVGEARLTRAAHAVARWRGAKHAAMVNVGCAVLP